MPYEFTEWEREPEPQTSSARSGVLPRKFAGIGMLDPPIPPKQPVGPIPGIPASMLLRIFAALILLGVTAFIVSLFLARH